MKSKVDAIFEYDVIVIGAGAVGCAVARELSRYDLSVAVLEKNGDVAGETSGRNSAVVHAGFNNKPGSLMASLCVEGNRGFGALCEALDVPFRQTGKLVVGFDDFDVQTLEHLLQQGRANGCPDLEILRGTALRKLLWEHQMEEACGSIECVSAPEDESERRCDGGATAGGIDLPEVKIQGREGAGSTGPVAAGSIGPVAVGNTGAVATENTGPVAVGSNGPVAALWSPHTGITNPFLYCVALAENAQANGVKFYLDTEVTGIRRLGTDAAGSLDVPGDPDETGMRFAVETRCMRGTGRLDFLEASAANECGDAANDHCIAANDHYIAANDHRDAASDGDGTRHALHCRYLINCAGLQADRIAAMAMGAASPYRIYPCRGEYFILDKSELPMPVYPAPRKGIGGLGVHLTPTMEGNILIGPSAEYLEDAHFNEEPPDEGQKHSDDSSRASGGVNETSCKGGHRDDYACTRPVMEQLMAEAVQLMPAIRHMQPIGNYSGIRPKLAPPGEGGYHDFVIQAEQVPGLINLIGIESPGLTASVPIARRVCRIIDALEGGANALQANAAADGKRFGSRETSANRLAAHAAEGSPADTQCPEPADAHHPERADRCATGDISLPRKPDFRERRRGILRFRDQSPARQTQLITEDPDYGEIVCRCQQISKREIRDAIENPLGARSISAIKYRAWATTGRCNGGYCLPRIAAMLVEDYGVDPAQVRHRDPGSELFTGRVK